MSFEVKRKQQEQEAKAAGTSSKKQKKQAGKEGKEGSSVEGKIRLLYVVPNMQPSGLENYLMNLIRHLDRDRFQVAVLEHHDTHFFFDDELARLGVPVFRLPVLDDKNLLAYLCALRAFFHQHHFDIVHGHQPTLAMFYLQAARRAGVPVRILHSHNSATEPNLKGLIKRGLFKIAAHYPNRRLACSKAAGDFLFGQGRYQLAFNGIEVERFRFNLEVRTRLRTRMQIPADHLVIGHIGRFNVQKNHRFLLRIFQSLLTLEPKATLVLLGGGEDEGVIKTEIDQLGLTHQVRIQPVTNQPEQYYSAFDAFVLPSLFEGLPLVGVEAQAAGLPSFFSDEVTKEVALSDRAYFYSLDASPASWAAAIIQGCRALDTGGRSPYCDLVARTDYAIQSAVAKIERYYSQALQELR